jgi:hypothetical protein
VNGHPSWKGSLRVERENETCEDEGAGEGDADDGGAGDSSLSLLLLSIVGGVSRQGQAQQMRLQI